MPLDDVQQLAGDRPDGSRVEEQARDAVQMRRDGVRSGRIALGDLHTGGQAGGLRGAGDGPNIGALANEQVNEGAPDVAGRSGYQNHVHPIL